MTRTSGFSIAALFLLTATSSDLTGQGRPVPRTPPIGSRVPILRPKVKASYPHDSQAFTQGLEFDRGSLFESTGLHGRSSIRRVELETGRVLQETKLASQYFGEGLTVWQSKIIQLTWETQIGFVYDRDTFRRTGTFRYKGEGWGLTHNATNLIMSDGSATLRFLDPDSFAEKQRLLVTDAGIPVTDLNELEWIDREIYANVWRTNFIARISPKGRVASWLDLGDLVKSTGQGGDNVLNGIAYDSRGRRLFVTGKQWPRVFEISVE
jgi:glutaminyl-peptide cyclotransferase